MHGAERLGRIRPLLSIILKDFLFFYITLNEGVNLTLISVNRAFRDYFCLLHDIFQTYNVWDTDALFDDLDLLVYLIAILL